jgi:UDP-N-acetylglucosamine--N-acetylmuramyl-(pentapeptide) pyrophosphoryl-undecaprenol N-acetylglucosamine transferase
MESQLVPPRGFAFETSRLSGVRGKGARRCSVAVRSAQGFWQSIRVVRRVKPDVVSAWGATSLSGRA